MTATAEIVPSEAASVDGALVQMSEDLRLSIETRDLALLELFNRLSDPEHMASLKIDEILKVVKYMDSRTLAIERLAKELGLSKIGKKVEKHNHLTLVFNKSADEIKQMSEPEKKLYLDMRIKAASAFGGTRE